MVQGIKFMDKRFKTENDYNLLSEMTDNTIILCNNCKLMNTLTDEICDTINGKAEYNGYYCEDRDINNAKIVLRSKLQRVIDINGQYITIALEPAIIYKAKKINDIWFFSWNGSVEQNTYKEFIYPMAIFEGSNEIWNSGLDQVYKIICNERYGAYDGKWINISEDRRENFYERN